MIEGKLRITVSVFGTMAMIMLATACVGEKQQEPKVLISSSNIMKQTGDETSRQGVELRTFGVLADGKTNDSEPHRNYLEFQHSGNGYYLEKPFGLTVRILDEEKKPVKIFQLSSYARDAVILPITSSKHNEYLALYIDFDATTNSSKIYVLDKAFNVIYEERLYGARGIGTTECAGSKCRLIIYTNSSRGQKRGHIFIYDFV